MSRKNSKANINTATISKKKEFSWFSNLSWTDSYASLFLGMLFVFLSAGIFFLTTFRHNVVREASSVSTRSTTTRISGVEISKPVINRNPRQADLGKNDLPKGKQVYTVVAGDNLWGIAEKFYKDGYSWTKIAKANNLADASVIHAGNKLVIPTVVPSVEQNEQVAIKANTPVVTPKVTAKSLPKTYTVVKGDTLWSIAVKIYGNGYQWSEIARSNNLANPGLIFSGNVLQIPPPSSS